MLHASSEVVLNAVGSKGGEAMPNRGDRDGEWGNGAIVAVIAAMVVVMPLIVQPSPPEFPPE
jgi:hypothetical protein